MRNNPAVIVVEPTEMELYVTSEDTDPWEGGLEEFLDSQSQELPEFVRRRIVFLDVGEEVSFDFPTNFTVRRTA